jgi:glycine dehydrogenase subunit 1
MNNQQEPQFPYLPHTKEDRQIMLQSLGVRSFEELLQHIPDKVRIKELNLPEGLSEQELSQTIANLAKKNESVSGQKSFLGGGAYYRYVPAAVGALVSRSEFATAYTPYQPEVSQGSLQTIYEFQTAVCLLTGMEVANASMYDGPTACAEACMMAVRLTGRNNIVLPASLNPEYASVTKTYASCCAMEIGKAKVTNGVIDLANLRLDDKTAALVVQYPNYFGCLEDLEKLAQECHQVGALLVVVTDPISLGLLTAPGTFGADIVVGDAQSCGNGLSFGGPSAGYLACRKDFMRQLPGRIAGVTTDNRGNRAFTLTLQTREQHIRRERATSNICTNQALNALTMLVYLTLLGPKGLHDLSNISIQRAHNLADSLCKIEGVSLAFEEPFFNEFVLQLPINAKEALDKLKAEGILGGIDLGKTHPDLEDCILVAVTEMNSPEDLNSYASALSSILAASANRVQTKKKSQMVLV